jgi:hypothetical protein
MIAPAFYLSVWHLLAMSHHHQGSNAIPVSGFPQIINTNLLQFYDNPPIQSVIFGP